MLGNNIDNIKLRLFDEDKQMEVWLEINVEWSFWQTIFDYTKIPPLSPER